jgi:hypothetical protein
VSARCTDTSAHKSHRPWPLRDRGHRSSLRAGAGVPRPRRQHAPHPDRRRRPPPPQ